MNKIWLVFKNEFISIVTRKSFLITLFLIPIAGFVVTLIISAINQNSSSPLAEIFSPAPGNIIQGYVDNSGLIKNLPEGYSQENWIAYSDENSAKQALQQGIISAYFIVPQDYIEKGNISYVRADFSPISGLDQADPFLNILKYNLLGQNQQLTNRLNKPLNLDVITLSATPQRDQANPMTFFLPYIVTMLFYIVIMTASSLMLNSISIEKQNRVIEILLASITPTQMLTGKIIALGLVGLLQTTIWSGSGLLLLRLSGRTFNLGAAFQLPITILIWGGVFFILGYAVYASLMAGIGALVPNLKEASQATTIVILPMVVPLILISSLIQQPDGGIALGLSLFPLTAPIAMMARLSATNVPIWQLAASIVLLALTAVLLVRAVAGMFRAQTLLSGQTFSIKLFFRALAGKA